MEVDYKALTNSFRGKFTRLRDEKFPGISFSLDDGKAFLKNGPLDQGNNLFIVVQIASCEIKGFSLTSESIGENL